MTRARAALLAAVLLAAGPARAQYRFDNWTTDDGLPQNSVRGIVQTRDGYVWFTTFDGLVRFDGVRFTVFRKGNTPGIPSNRFISLFEDRAGDLWASLESGDVVRRHQGRFTTYLRPEGASIYQLVLADDGHGHPMAYDAQAEATGNRVTLIRLRFYRIAESRLIAAPELTRTLDVDHAIALRGGVGPVVGLEVWRYRGDQLVSDSDGRRLSLEDGTLPVSEVLSREGAPRILVRDAIGALWLVDTRTAARELLASRAPPGFDQTGAAFSGIADAEGNLWLPSNGGLFRARKETISSLATGETYPILETRDGAIWIGAEQLGLYRLRNGVLSRELDPDKHPLLQSYTIQSLYEDRSGQLWVDGLYRLAGGRLVLDPTVAGLTPIQVTAMCEDRDGAVWRGWLSGVARTQGGQSTTFTTRDGLAGGDTKVIIDDGHGGLWIGATGGLTHYSGGRFTAYTEKDGLPGSTVRALKRDADGTLWIGTYDSGLGRFKDGRFTRVTAADGLFDDGVFMILPDDAGWFWMSCNRGIYRCKRQELVDVAEGRAKRVTCVAYTKSDGMPSTECNGGRWPAGVRTRDGRLLFPTMGGVAIVDPTRLRSNVKPPPVVIEGMRIGSERVGEGDWAVALRGSSAIRVLPGQQSFEIDYTALSFVGSENLRFRHRLEGAERDWVDAGTRRTAHYALVPPGSYTFRVIAANADGVWNETGARVRITVVPPFHRTWWFRTLAALAATAALAAAWRLRVGQLRRTQAAQQEAQQRFARQLIESQEHERKRIAAELHDGLGQQILMVKQRAQRGLTSEDVPALRDELASIAATAGQSLDDVRGIAQNLRPYHLDYLGLTKALEVMIDNLAATTTTRIVRDLMAIDDLFGKEDAITLYRVVQESLSNVVKHAGASEARVTIDRTPESVVVTIQDDGCGFAGDGEGRGHGFGLSGMAERVRMLGGDLRVESHPGRGTAVVVQLAIKEGREGGRGGTPARSPQA